MSAISPQTTDPRANRRIRDPRVVRSRAAVIQAARALFLERGFAGTTMEDIAARAGLTKRTVYNNYADKEALFLQFTSDVIAFAQAFADDLPMRFNDSIGEPDLAPALRELARRLALAIVRDEVVALRRLLIGEARAFPRLARDYFDSAPGRVIETLADILGRLAGRGLLRIDDARTAAEQFAYLIAGPPLDRATLTGSTPRRNEILRCADEGVRTFLARYGRAGRPAA